MIKNRLSLIIGCACVAFFFGCSATPHYDGSRGTAELLSTKPSYGYDYSIAHQSLLVDALNGNCESVSQAAKRLNAHGIFTASEVGYKVVDDTYTNIYRWSCFAKPQGSQSEFQALASIFVNKPTVPSRPIATIRPGKRFRELLISSGNPEPYMSNSISIRYAKRITEINSAAGVCVWYCESSELVEHALLKRLAILARANGDNELARQAERYLLLVVIRRDQRLVQLAEKYGPLPTDSRMMDDQASAWFKFKIEALDLYGAALRATQSDGLTSFVPRAEADLAWFRDSRVDGFLSKYRP